MFVCKKLTLLTDEQANIYPWWSRRDFNPSTSGKASPSFSDSTPLLWINDG